MWIAKPLAALTSDESAAWTEITKSRNAPMAQTLDWASATQSTGAKVYVIFSPDEKVGGVFFQAADILECINGPVIDWPCSVNCPRQIATLVMAAAKLKSGAKRVVLQPRWSAIQSAESGWLSNVPIEPYSVFRASTIVIDTSLDAQKIMESFAPRLRRTLRRAEKCGATFDWRAIHSDADLGDFPERLKKFGRSKGFFVPDRRWFVSLLKGSFLKCYLARSSYTSSDEKRISTEILIGTTHDSAHYLFGCEERDSSLKSSVSTAAWVHFQAALKVAGLGCVSYDFNGYVRDPAGAETYAGVSAFKKQFGGTIVDYSSPKWVVDIA